MASVLLAAASTAAMTVPPSTASNTAAEPVESFELRGDAGGKRFDGIGVVSGAGATSVLLKDYPEPQRSQIMDLVYKPMFGASVSALLAEIPGDGNSTQGSMPSHMHTRDDLNFSRGYIWWTLQQAVRRNPALSLDGTAWSGPGWLGNGEFWSEDTANYYVTWLQGLRDVYGLHLDAIGCRNERGQSFNFARRFRAALNANGFASVKLHAFDNWPADKLDFVKQLPNDPQTRDAIDILSGHVFYGKPDGHVSPGIQALAAQMGKPIWDTEDHVYLDGFACELNIVRCFNLNFIQSGATRITLWYDIAGVYPIEPYAVKPAMLLAHSPWSGHYEIREALWGYAHYGQFSQAGWQYLNGGCRELRGGGSVVTLKSAAGDYSVIVETANAPAPQRLQFHVGGGLAGRALCVWRSNAQEQFVRLPDLPVEKGSFMLTAEPDSIYSVSTTTGQHKGSFADIPPDKPFPYPYRETFDEYEDPETYGYLPRYFADIAGAFELVAAPGRGGQCLQQVVPIPTLSWAPDWLPYTIVGDDKWSNYDASADVYLKPGDAAAVMGHVNDVGTGWGFIPKGYYLELNDSGECRLVVVRGKIDKKKLVGDGEQQALIKAQKDESEGGEKVLATAKVPNIKPNAWHTLTLRFNGAAIEGLVDGTRVMSVNDGRYPHGMAGLLAGGTKTRLSTPYFDNVTIKPVAAPTPPPISARRGQARLYPGSKPRG